MPQLQGVTVRVTDVEGNDLEEWGIQKLRGNKVSAYIKSTSDQIFRVSVQPRIPYFDDEPRLESDDVHIKMEDSSGDLVGQPSSSRGSGRRDTRYQADPPHKSRRNRKSRRSSSSLGHHPGRGAFETTGPPYSFVATLYLDGRRKAERKVVVYLDPTDDDFKPPSGLVTFKCRTVLGHDGSLMENAWVFRDIGIETMFDKIGLRETATEAVEAEDVLVDAMKTSKLGDDGHAVAGEENERIGQIVVELERVKLGKKYYEKNYLPKHTEGDVEDVDMSERSDMAHKTGFEYLKRLDQQSTRCVEYSSLVKGEKPWATFQFFYRSHEQLQKFNFPGWCPQDSPQQRQPLGTILSNLTPLSIAHSKYQAPVFSKPEELSFETRVKEGTHDPTEPKYEFYDYRDPQKEALTETRQLHGQKGKRSNSSQLTADANGRSSEVVAVGEKTRIRFAHPKFNAGPRKPRSSSVSSLSLSRSPPNPPVGSPIQQPPANSPTACSYNANADGPPTTHQGSRLDISKTLSSASLALTKAKNSLDANGQSTPARSTISNRDIFRGEREASSSSSDADADYEQDGDDEYEQGSLESVNNDDAERETHRESDKENQPSSTDNTNNNNNDMARLHDGLKQVTLGSKRQRGEGTEGLEPEIEEGEIAEKDDPNLIADSAEKKKKKPTISSTPRPNIWGQAVEGKKEQQPLKRVKLLETPSTQNGGGEPAGGSQSGKEKPAEPITLTLTMDEDAAGGLE
ncbi:MAG: hypothetical protein Q9168_002573 [Polycauliona sp. 1 TL-2023]